MIEGDKPTLIPGVNQMQLVLGVAVVGGLLAGSVVAKQMFVEGLEDEERRGVLIVTAAALLTWGAKELFDIDEQWVEARVRERLP